MSPAGIPIVVLSTDQGHVELINRLLREAGQPAHCHWVAEPDALAERLMEVEPELLWFFSDGYELGIATIAKLRQSAGVCSPLLVVASDADESRIGHAMAEGADDLISITATARMQGVAKRELRSTRVERALNDTLISATQYKKQLRELMADAVDAIAMVSEGIIVEANEPWAKLFRRDEASIVGELIMDLFDPGSQSPLKGALTACQKGRWDANALRLNGKVSGTEDLKVWLKGAEHEGEPATQLTIHVQPQAVSSQQRPSGGASQRSERDQFLSELGRRITAKRRSGVRALCHIQPDDFGNIKKSVGTLSSEELLDQIAPLLQKFTEDSDLFCRFSGSEFLVYLERGAIRDVKAWAENVVAAAGEQIFEVNEQSLNLTLSIGIAEPNLQTATLESLLQDAQRALERSQERGGNQASLEETPDIDTQRRRLDHLWVRRIKSALMENRFRLVHLPITKLAGDSGTIFDTVVRMLDEQEEEIAPADFFPAAERNQLTKNIDRWVIGASFAYCLEKHPERLFIRLSAQSIVDDTLVGWLTQAVASKKFAADSICFQVSEADAVQHVRSVRELATAIRAIGFKFAISHFGTSKDPLKTLSQFPMDYLKIDGSLMQGLASSLEIQGRVSTYVAAAEQKGIGTIAERVENANTMAVLFQLGVSYMEGHYVHEPEVVLGEEA